MSLRAVTISLVLPILAACAADPVDPDEARLDEVALCLPSLGGHEVCDGVDNDCDDLVDESCGPIEVDLLHGYACPGTAGSGRLAVGDASTVFILRSTSGTLNRVSANGALSVDVNPSLPPWPRQIGRAATGNLFVYGLHPAYPSSYYEERADILSPATGSTISTLFTSSGFDFAFTMDPLDRPLLAGDSVYDIEHYDGTGTEHWASVGFWDDVMHMVAGGAIGERIYYVTTLGLYRTTPYIFGGEAGEELVLSTAGGYATVALDDQGRVYYSREAPRGDMSVIERFEPDGSGQVTLAKGDFDHPIAYDPETHELVVWSSTGGRPCPAGAYGQLKRIEL